MSSDTELDGFALFIIAAPSDRLSVLAAVAGHAERCGRDVRGFVSADHLDTVRSSLELAGHRVKETAIRSVESTASGEDPRHLAVSEILDKIAGERREGNGPADGGQPVLLVDLDAVFAVCTSTREMMDFARRLERDHVRRGRTVCCLISRESLPAGMPSEFFDLFATCSLGGLLPASGRDGPDRAVERLVLRSPELRHLLIAESDDSAIASLVPHVLQDLRYGILIVDPGLTIRYCSRRAAVLLGRTATELLDLPLSTCIDGVDFVTVKHECEKLEPGAAGQSPFVLSWRGAGGAHETGQVAVDPLSGGGRILAYLLTLSPVETLRGPRAVYRQLTTEKTPGGPDADSRTADAVSHEEPDVNDDLQGAQITRREHEIVLLVLNDMSNRQIARHLGIAEVTVKKHLTSVYRKLRMTSRRELLASFARPGDVV